MASPSILPARPTAPKRGRTKAPTLTPPPPMRLFDFLCRHPLTDEQLAALTGKTLRAVSKWKSAGEAPLAVQITLYLLDKSWVWD